MANIRKFDEAAVLDTILHVFWDKGYEATSLDDLVAATGVKRQSLYNAFGNKEAMFLHAYEHYLTLLDERMEAAVAQSDGTLHDQVKQILQAFLAAVVDANSPAGCFLTNAAVEFGCNQDADITCRLKEHFKHVEKMLFDMLKTAQKKGELSKKRDARAIAQFLVASITSIAVAYRLNNNKAFAQNVLNEALHVLN